MRLIKLENNQFNIITDGTIEYSNICQYGVKNIETLNNWNDILEQIGDVDLEYRYPTGKNKQPSYISNRHEVNNSCRQEGYLQCLIDNKDKKYTVKDLEKMFIAGGKLARNIEAKLFSESLEDLQSKTEWNIEIKDNKIILL